MERGILHLDLVDFPVAVERIRDRSLQGRALLIAHGHARSRVLCASAEALECGVRVGMPLPAAQKLCRGARVIPPDQRILDRAEGAVVKLLSRYTPTVEPEKPGRLFVDLSGTARLWGPVRDTGMRIGREIAREVRLLSNLGLSTSKSTSRVAAGSLEKESRRTGDVRDNMVDVFPGSEAAFLSPHPAPLLPGTDEVDTALLDELNIRLICKFAQLTPGRLALVFGKMGPVLHLRAKGCDPRPVHPPRKNPSITEEETLPADTSDREELLAAAKSLALRGAFRLRTSGHVARTLHLVVGYCDNMSAEGFSRIHPPSQADAQIARSVENLLYRTMIRRVRVSYLKITLTDLERHRQQMSLFPKSDRAFQDDALTGAMDAIRARFGTGAIERGSWAVSPT